MRRGIEGGFQPGSLLLWYDRREKELLFVNKKKQKNFLSFSAGMFQRRAKRSKRFLVLFFKKELLASNLIPSVMGFDPRTASLRACEAGVAIHLSFMAEQQVYWIASSLRSSQ
jgi:hypothetical protein